MDHRTRTAMIESYSLKDCVALLAAFAPDLLEQIAGDIRLHPDDPRTLDAARRAVHAAIARERQLN